MIAKTVRLGVLVVLIPLFAARSGIAQDLPPATVPQYPDFSKFSTVVPADQLGFFDRLRLAGMKFVKAPAVKRIVPLYKYSKEDIVRSKCSRDTMRDRRALVFAQLIPVDRDSSVGSGEREGDGSSETRTASRWREPGSDQDARGTAVPVWYGLRFSDSCDLREQIKGLEVRGVDWQIAGSPTLRSIIRGEGTTAQAGNTSTLGLISTEPFTLAGNNKPQYLAECASGNRAGASGSASCTGMLAAGSVPR